MGLGDILRTGIAIADRVTGGSGGLQGTVLLYPWEGSGDYGEADFGIAIPVDAIIDERQYKRRLKSGDDVIQRAEITILRPIAPNGAENRREPIDTRDKIVLPSGYTGPILDIDGPHDSLTGAPSMFRIILG
jgi:hypothetical protein